MSKLYVFGIGGTGSRVIRALTMLLASGVDCGDYTIVPIIIDPDQSAADLTRTVELMKRYVAVRQKLDFSEGTKNKFFKTEILKQVDGFRLPLNSNTADKKFKDYIQLGAMSTANQALMRMLFSENNLESDMVVGFKGNPNIGSVVLNQFQDSKEFKEFATGFQQGDKIFIISSIFGGTGASGFPLLLKTLRHDNDIPNNGVINNSIIGAVSVLPYFGVQPSDTSEIDSTTFVSKTKSALSYYERNISDTNDINYLYYLADDVHNTYENHEGGITQRNKAHMIELWAALAAIDFAKNSVNQKPALHKEFGTATMNEPLTFADLGSATKELIASPLSQMALFARFMDSHCAESCEKQPWAKDHKLQSKFMDGDFVKNLLFVQSDGNTGFMNWLEEMESNNRSFAPFNWNNNDPISIIRGFEVKYPFINTKGKGFDFFDYKLNVESQNCKAAKANYSEEQKLMEFFYAATKSIVTEKLEIINN